MFDTSTSAVVSDKTRLRVVITIDTAATGWELLAPGGKKGLAPTIGRCELILNPDSPIEADFWIVFGNSRPSDLIRCAPENTIFIAGEPEGKKVYPKKFYRQFHRVIDTHMLSGHPRVKLHAPCLNWLIGHNHELAAFDYGYEQLSALKPPDNLENKVSVVCSDAAFTEGQRKRLSFLDELKTRLGDKLVHFGRGFRSIDDKLKAIHGFRFHLAMENSCAPHYWTEKISDAYLGWAFPLYIGSPNISEYFPEKCLLQLDVNSPEDAAAKIEELLKNPQGPDELAAIAEGRQRVLDVYNPWVTWARWAEEYHDPTAERKLMIIRSHKAFRPFPRGLIYRFRNARSSNIG